MFTVGILIIGSLYTIAYWLYYFVNDIENATAIWSITSLSFAVLTALIAKKMYEINGNITKRLFNAALIFMIGVGIIYFINEGNLDEGFVGGVISMVSFSLLYLTFSLDNIYMRLFSFSYILVFITDIAFFNFYGSSIEANITIDMLYFFIYSIWVLLFGGLALELLKMKEKEINIIERWKHADP